MHQSRAHEAEERREAVDLPASRRAPLPGRRSAGGAWAPPGPPKVTVVVPTYNEAENLPELVRRLAALDLPRLEVLVVDDSSPDGTAEVAQRLAAAYPGLVRVLRRPGKQGLGTAYAQGFAEAVGAGADFVVEMDADLSHPPEALPRMLAEAGTCDVVVGSRWVPGAAVEPGWRPARRLLSRAGSLYARLVLGLKVRDATTGFKCFSRAALARLDPARVKSQGFAFQVEMAHICQRRGLRVREVPINFTGRSRGKSKLSLWIIIEALWRVLAIRLRRGRTA